VMAKASRPGKVKTRLAPPLTLEQSAAINTCFLKDTTANIAALRPRGRSIGVISYTPVGDEALFEGLLPQEFSLLPQRGDGFGQRLLASAEDLLACGFGAVCLIDSDSPTVPASAFAQAVEALSQPGDRIVLGPSSDGGYYLIGLKQAHPQPFKNISWSTSLVYEETVVAIRTAGIELVELPTWYDVDDGATLEILRAELLDGARPSFAALEGYAAEHSRQFLADRQSMEARS
jgi:rSAM/selenodomain-associated transferase 1